MAAVEAREARLALVPSGGAGATASPTGAVPPLFAPAGPEVAVRLDGLSRTPRRSAALLSVGGGPAEWVQLGATRGGITLVEVRSTRVVVESRTGRRTVALGETSDPAAAVAEAKETPPPGVRLPPAPASAPGG